MAPGIAAACAAAGAEVTIAARNEERAAAAARVAGVPAAPFARKTVGGADLVVETIVEDASAKTHLYQRIEPWLAPEAVLTSNTSSLGIGSLAEALAQPQRFAGFHFLNPAALSCIVEVVPGPKTSRETIERLAEFGCRMGKTPLVLRRDAPGFVWNRIQFAVLRECLHMLDEGIADACTIDAAVADGLAPRWMGAGPLATAQLGGLETFRLVAGQLFPALGAERTVSEALGRGFYDWDDETRDAIVALRNEAIDFGSRMAKRRPA